MIRQIALPGRPNRQALRFLGRLPADRAEAVRCRVDLMSGADAADLLNLIFRKNRERALLYIR
jgi:hypothetical protein